MGRARALLKSITTSKTGLYYLYGRYPSQILGDPEHKGGVPLAANFLIISSEICRQYKILVFYELYDDFVCGTEIIWVFCMRKGILYGHFAQASG